MPTGNPRLQRGFTYLGLLFVISLLGASLAAAGVTWQHRVQRELELESMFRGQQIADAIGAWRAASSSAAEASEVTAPPSGPPDLASLLEDRRTGKLSRHLRRVYPDPLTGLPDWTLLRDPDGSLIGLRSRSDRPALIQIGLTAAQPGRPLRVSDRLYTPRTPNASAAAVPTIPPDTAQAAPGM
jgi:type II secretory pathway pseudopilin PulG